MPGPADAPLTARPPKRLFRLGPAANPLTLRDTGDGPWDDPAGDRALHLFSTRRGALLATLADPSGITPDSLAGCAIVPVQVGDPRPFLDLRNPPALPPDRAAMLGDRRALLAWADDAGLAGIVDAVPDAPTQARWALADPDSARALAPPQPLSPHDPDLVAVRRLLGESSRRERDS